VAEGLQSSIALHTEAVYGTEDTGVAYHVVPFLTETLQKQFNRLITSNIDTNPAPDDAFTTGSWAAGAISMLPTYENLDWALLGVLGSGVGTPNVTEFDNVYAPTLAVPSFSFEVDRNESAGKVFKYVGMKVSSLSLNWTSTGEPSATVSVVGQDETSISGGDTKEATARVVLAGDVMSPTQALIYNIGTGSDTTYCLSDISINITRNITPDRFCIGAATTVLEPLVSSKMEVTGSFTIESDDRAPYEIFTAQTAVTAIHIQFEGALIAGTNDFTMDIYVPNAKYDAPTCPQVSGPGPVLTTVNFTAFGNAGTGVTKEPINFTTLNQIDADVY
jgi:hypothetical protein